MAQATLHKILQGHTYQVQSVAFSPDSKLIASASSDNTVRLWNVPNGDLNAELKGHTSFVSSVDFSPDGKSIVTGSGGNTVRTWSIATKQQLKILTHTNSVYSVTWSPNGALIASGSKDTTVILWDAIAGSAKIKLTGHTSWVLSVSFSQNGNKLASAGDDKTAIIWDVNSGAALIKLAHSSIVWSVCFSHDDQFVVTGCHDNIVHMFNSNTGRVEKRFEGHVDRVLSVAISFDGSMIASGSSDKSVRLWDVSSTKQLQRLDGHTQAVWSVAFSRDGKFIASGSNDSTVRLWNAPSSLQRQILPKPFSPEMNKSETETQQKQKQQQEIEIQQKIAAEVEKQKQEQLTKKEKELLAKQQEIENQQKEIERQKAEQQKREQEIAYRERKQREELEKQKKEEEAKRAKATLDPTQVAKWTVDDVCAFLKQADIDDDVIAIFRKQKIRGPVLSQYAKEDKLKSIGVDADGDRQFVIHVINQLLVSPSNSINSGFKVHEILRRELTKDIKLSEGNFGIVWRGTFTGIPVAIKEPKLYGADLNPKKQLADLVEEATVMTSISNNPYVLHCYGISRVGQDDYLLVTELCNLGSLDAFLRAYPGTPAVDRRRFSQQVARGLNHLGKHNVAHRDVAARNVLLHDQGGMIVAKVCDFGLSRQREGEYYMVTGQHLLSPETAPEVLTTGKHSSRSDVWSFGVLLWEVESLCATRARPDTQSFPPLSKPAQASDNMYAIMLKCWAKDPHQRPSFEALIDLLA